MTRKRKAFAVVFFALLLVLTACSPGSSPTRPTIVIGSTHNESDTLLYIADEQGFFAANGLSVTIKDYSAGAAGVEGLLKGEVSATTASEYVLVQNALKGVPISTIGIISKNYSIQLVGRSGRGIATFSDLVGKKIGVPAQTLARFQLGRFLALQGIEEDQVKIIDIDIADSVEVVLNGTVDAVQTWEPYASRIKETLGKTFVVWAQSEQPQYKNVLVTNTLLQQYPDTARQFLKALRQAESFVALNPDKTRAIIQKRLQYDDAYMASAWPKTQCSLSLDFSLVLAMEDEARWMMSNNLTAQRTMPDFFKFIYQDALKSIKPEAVGSIR